MITMKNLVERMKMDEKLLESHPDDKTILKHIEKTKSEIIECVMKNADNSWLMERITM